MRSPSLSTWLTAFTVGIVVVTTAVVGVAGFAVLRRLAEDEAIARVRLGSTSALGAMERDGSRLLISARLLAERPTLRRILSSGDVGGSQEYLSVFQRTSLLSGCAVVVDGRVRVAVGSLPWDELLRRRTEVGHWFVSDPSGTAPLVLAATCEIPGFPGGEVMVAHRLDRAYAEKVGDKVELEVEIFTRRPEDLSTPLRRQAIVEERLLSGRDVGPERFLAVQPLSDPSGTVAGGIEATLPAAIVETPLKKLARTLLLLTAGVGIVAALFSLGVARRVARPVGTLTAAAARIGLGDFSLPVPRVGGLETGTLAATMEEMRGRILRLTTELRHRKAQAEAILSGIAEGVFAVDRERRLRYLNPQAAALLGIDVDQAIGRFCGDVLHPQKMSGDRPCDSACPILHARFRGNAQATEHLLLAGGDRRTVVITSAHPATEEENAAEQADQFQVLRDETEAEATRRLRDAVLANISHEFRSPLSAQLASIELLRDQLPELDRDEILALVLSLERGALRLTRLIDNLLESTRIEAGQHALRRREVALDEVVEEAVGLMAPLIDQRHQQLEVNLPYPLPPILGDGPRLTQVLVNLLANANKFSPAETTIHLGAEVGEDEIRVWVEDEGGGLPAGAAEKLFERFMRAPGDEPEQRGIGLGLWIVKSIVDRHGGRVEAASSLAGTRMDVFLPRWRNHENPDR